MIFIAFIALHGLSFSLFEFFTLTGFFKLMLPSQKQDLKPVRVKNSKTKKLLEYNQSLQVTKQMISVKVYWLLKLSFIMCFVL